MLNVFLTVDTEIWHQDISLKSKINFKRDMDTYIYGKTPSGSYGVPMQMGILNECGLKATYFVESLFASVVGISPLCEIVELIKSGGHDVQLHLHPEWYGKHNYDIDDKEVKHFLHQFNLADQTSIISEAVSNLNKSGVANVSAFRAGNYGASAEMISILDNNGISYDSSYNHCYLNKACKISLEPFLTQPTRINNVYEFPITFFKDYMSHYRHAQLCACSTNEMEHALMTAWRENWYSFVIVFHSFELLNIHRYGGHPKPDTVIVKRFKRLCKFLENNKDKFITKTFSSIDKDLIPDHITKPIIKSPLLLTTLRFSEQFLRRINNSMIKFRQ